MRNNDLLILQNNIIKFMMESIDSNIATTDSLSGINLDRIKLLSKLMLHKYADNIARLLPITSTYLNKIGSYQDLVSSFLKKYPPTTLTYFENIKYFYQYIIQKNLYQYKKYKYLKSILEYEMNIAFIRNNMDKSIRLLKLNYDISDWIEKGTITKKLLTNREVYLLMYWDDQNDISRVMEVSKKYFYSLN